jgi:hypothetical protein
MTILVAGDPSEGYRFVGPWQQSNEAMQWAERNLEGITWWAVELEAPNGPDDVVY